MKLIMENWKRFLNEQKPLEDDPIWDKLKPLLPALAQDAMEVVDPDNPQDAASITLATMAQSRSDLPLIDMESVAAITLGDLYDEVGLQNIMQGAAASATDSTPPVGGQWSSPGLPDGEDSLQEERGLGLEEGFGVSTEDLVKAGLPAASVQRGLFWPVVARLERSPSRGLSALSKVVSSLSQHQRRNVSVVMAALDKEL